MQTRHTYTYGGQQKADLPDMLALNPIRNEFTNINRGAKKAGRIEYVNKGTHTLPPRIEYVNNIEYV